MQAEITEIKQLIKRPGAMPAAMPPQPNPADVYSVKIDGAPSLGPADAKVTVVEAFEFACPFCEQARSTIDTLRKDYGDNLRVVYKHFVVHPELATLPAQAACAANLQSRFEAMYNGIWENGFKANRNLSRDNLESIAKGIRLDVERFKKDMEGLCPALVQKDATELAKVGVTGTPSFYINGRPIMGARSVEQFKAVIDEELKKADERIAKGQATKADYYNKYVVQMGKKQL
jgi:protein-disulfide isomerase